MSIQVPDGYVLTAADYLYMDAANTLYDDTKMLIAAIGQHEGTDRHAWRRPGIPGTIGTLNERLATLVELKQFGTAARLIEKKVRKAYKISGEQP